MFILIPVRRASFPFVPSISTDSILRYFPPAFFSLRRIQRHSTLKQPCNGYSDEQLHNLLQQCTKAQTLEVLRSFHAFTVILGPYARQPIYFSNNVITLYASFKELQSAHKVFDKMPQRNGVSYNALISAYSYNHQIDDAWEMFCDMLCCGFGPTQFTFGSLLSCPSLDIRRGCTLHGLMLSSGLFSDPHGGTSLIGMYGRHGCIDDAFRAFQDMPEKNLVTWNSIISLLACSGFVQESLTAFCKLMRSNYGLSGSTMVGLITGLTGQEAPTLGEQIYSLAVKNGLNYDISTLNALLNTRVNYLDFASAERMLKEAPVRDVVTYNTLIGAFAKSERPHRGIELLFSLLVEEILPNETTYVGVINCCTNVRIPIYGKYIHAKVIRSSFQNDVLIGSALVDFYGKCSLLDSAYCCFDEIYDKNVVSWNSLIVAFSIKSHTTSANLLREMLSLAYCPDEFTFSAVLKSSSIFEVQQVHCLIMRMGYLKNEYVFNSLLTSYAKNGSLSDALLIATSMEMGLSVVSYNVIAATYSRARQYYKSLHTLSKVDEPDIVSWNILISACSHNGHHIEAFELFKHMVEDQIFPDNYATVSILCGCSSLRSLSLGSSVHGLLIKTNFKNCDTFVCNVLMDMYAKCGCIEDSLKIFKANRDKNRITWTIMISALGHHGFAHEALEMFKEMELLGIKPDAISFIAALSACRHGGLVKEGMELFSQMQLGYDIEPKMDHYHAVVDLLARHGHLKEAEQATWKATALLGRAAIGLEDNCITQKTNYQKSKSTYWKIDVLEWWLIWQSK
ncbi:hypothetical protein Cgig2_009057 [Carnegiea gigantea]|uniref:Pentatricopeptide repeat-containing protein n=1 Tax=Carnegiea gigantea TaxID=171969 RepID=A0A9Q1GSJ2_9CARY|nr:hypothetical protein Cgig2_009057 [Carnegiea gigantea]